jgi:hypothetical protein
MFCRVLNALLASSNETKLSHTLAGASFATVFNVEVILKLDIRTASGWLERLVRCGRLISYFLVLFSRPSVIRPLTPRDAAKWITDSNMRKITDKEQIRIEPEGEIDAIADLQRGRKLSAQTVDIVMNECGKSLLTE